MTLSRSPNSGGVGLSKHREDHGGSFLSHPLLQFGEPVGGSVEAYAWIEQLNPTQNL